MVRIEIFWPDAHAQEKTKYPLPVHVRGDDKKQPNVLVTKLGYPLDTNLLTNQFIQIIINLQHIHTFSSLSLPRTTSA